MFHYHNFKSSSAHVLSTIICFATIIILAGCGGGGGGSASDAPHFNSHSYLYMASGDLGGTISQTQLVSGTSIPLNPSTVPSAKTPSTAIASPDGHYFYVADKNSGAIYQYAISGTGILQPLSPGSITLTNGAQPSFMLFDNSGRYLYIASISTSTISVLSVGDDGTLTRLGADINLNGQPMTLASDHSGNIYASLFNVNGNTIVHFTSSNGPLTHQSEVSIPGDSIWDTMLVDTNRNKLYAVREGAGTNTGTIVVYNIDAGGNLTQSGNPIPTNSNPENALIDNTGSVLVMHTGNGLDSYNLNNDSYLNSQQLAHQTPNIMTPPFKPTAPDNDIHQSIMEGTSDNGVYAVCSVETYRLSVGTQGLGSPSVAFSGTTPIATAAVVNR